MPPRLMLWHNPIERQVSHWDFFRTVLPKFDKAFQTQEYTVLSCQFPFVCYRLTKSGIPSIFRSFIVNYIQRLTTLCTKSIFIWMSTRLSNPSVQFNSGGYIHNSSLPSTWYKNLDDSHWYNRDNQWTGMFIVKLTHLYVGIAKPITLQYPIYRISFCPNGDASKAYDVIDAPTLEKAKKLAEWYYSEWVKVKTGDI